jgi:hypothetical protein
MVMKLSTWSCLKTRMQDEVTIRGIKTDNSSFARVEDFEYLKTNLTNQNSIKKKLRAD